MYRFELEPYNGSSKHYCPRCHQKSFTLYIDTETGKPLGDDCGRCDHEQSCGYHVPPRDFFRYNPRQKAMYGSSSKMSTRKRVKPVEEKKPLCSIPNEYVEKYHSPNSKFVAWLLTLFPDKMKVKKTFEDYMLGATKTGSVVFWQIDYEGNVRSGKIMQYSSDGHRRGTPKWIHKTLQDSGSIPQDWSISQCFFGEHLLKQRPNDVVYLVESEKTAVVCSIRYPQFIWIATGGCGNLNAEKAKVLKGRRVVIFPDSGELKKWRKIMSETEDIEYSFFEYLEQYPANTDIADLVVEICLKENTCLSKQDDIYQASATTIN